MERGLYWKRKWAKLEGGERQKGSAIGGDRKRGLKRVNHRVRNREKASMRVEKGIEGNRIYHSERDGKSWGEKKTLLYQNQHERIGRAEKFSLLGG